ncbi:MAG: four helix bundle protein [Rhizobiaceae bacterium]
MAVKSYRDLIVWQKAMDLSVEIYRVSEAFPNEERFGLISQVRRSSVSIVANIAEGFGRDSKRDFVRYLRISQGSLKETETHLLLSQRLGMVDGKQMEAGLSLSDEIGKMLRSLIARIEQELK